MEKVGLCNLKLSQMVGLEDWLHEHGVCQGSSFQGLEQGFEEDLLGCVGLQNQYTIVTKMKYTIRIT